MMKYINIQKSMHKKMCIDIVFVYKTKIEEKWDEVTV